ncbi:MAG: DUF790 family protein [Pirellulaceae bacterium]|nr:DUF790 family protein [Pirellulaceae bacterium]
MLTSQEALAEFDFANGLIRPGPLIRSTHAHYLAAAEQLLKTYADSVGATRQVVHQHAEDILDQLPDCSSRRMSAIIKLLDDASQYASDSGRRATKLREQVFQAAAARHPLVFKAEGGSNRNTGRLSERLPHRWVSPGSRSSVSCSLT